MPLTTLPFSINSSSPSLGTPTKITMNLFIMFQSRIAAYKEYKKKTRNYAMVASDALCDNHELTVLPEIVEPRVVELSN